MLKVKVRNRVQLSCTNCRRRKAKCDRQQPCQRCERLGKAQECVYQWDRPSGIRSCLSTADGHDSQDAPEVYDTISVPSTTVAPRSHSSPTTISSGQDLEACSVAAPIETFEVSCSTKRCSMPPHDHEVPCRTWEVGAHGRSNTMWLFPKVCTRQPY